MFLSVLDLVSMQFCTTERILYMKTATTPGTKQYLINEITCLLGKLRSYFHMIRFPLLRLGSHLAYESYFI